jgi:hypothetical protein
MNAVFALLAEIPITLSGSSMYQTLGGPSGGKSGVTYNDKSLNRSTGGGGQPSDITR